MDSALDQDDILRNTAARAVQACADAVCDVSADWSTDSNVPALEWTITYLMTELWDRGFSSAEIDAAFKAALHQLPIYSADQR